MPCYYNLKSQVYQLTNNVASCPFDNVKSFVAGYVYYVVDVDNNLHVYDKQINLLTKSQGIKYVTFDDHNIFGINDNDKLVKIRLIGTEISRQLMITHDKKMRTDYVYKIDYKYDLEIKEAFDKPITQVVAYRDRVLVLDRQGNVWVKGYNQFGELVLSRKYYKKFTQVNQISGVTYIASYGPFTIFLLKNGKVSYHGKDIGKNTLKDFTPGEITKVCITYFNNYFLFKDGTIIETGDAPQLGSSIKGTDIASCGNSLAVCNDVITVYRKYERYGKIITEKPLVLTSKIV